MENISGFEPGEFWQVPVQAGTNPFWLRLRPINKTYLCSDLTLIFAPDQTFRSFWLRLRQKEPCCKSYGQSRYLYTGHNLTLVGFQERCSSSSQCSRGALTENPNSGILTTTTLTLSRAFA